MGVYGNVGEFFGDMLNVLAHFCFGNPETRKGFGVKFNVHVCSSLIISCSLYGSRMNVNGYILKKLCTRQKKSSSRDLIAGSNKIKQLQKLDSAVKPRNDGGFNGTDLQSGPDAF